MKLKEKCKNVSKSCINHDKTGKTSIPVNHIEMVFLTYIREIVTLDIPNYKGEISKMKRKWFAALFLLLVLVMTACGKKESVDTEARINSLMKELQEAQETITTQTEEKEKVQKELDEIKEVLQSTEDELKKSAESLDELKKQYENDRIEFAAYKEKMSAYEDLSETEKQAREAEARMMIQKEAEKQEEQRKKIAEMEEERRKEQEKIQKEQREIAKKDFNTGITYDQIARTPDKYKNEKVKFTGKILQVFERDSQNEIRLSVHKNEYGHYDGSQVIHCIYSPKLLDYRLLEGDIVTVYAVAKGLASSQVGGSRTMSVPLVYVSIIERKQ